MYLCILRDRDKKVIRITFWILLVKKRRVTAKVLEYNITGYIIKTNRLTAEARELVSIEIIER